MKVKLHSQENLLLRRAEHDSAARNDGHVSGAPAASVWMQFKGTTYLRTALTFCEHPQWRRHPARLGKERTTHLVSKLKTEASIPLPELKEKYLPVGEAQRSGNYQQWTLNKNPA